MAGDGGRVFSIVDEMIASHNPNFACENCKRPWIEAKRIIPLLIKVPDSHDIVRDMDGKLLCRQSKFSMERFYSEEANTTFKFYSSVMRMHIVAQIEKTGIRPNVFVALGGARLLSWEILISLRGSEYYPKFGGITMHKVLKGPEKRMVGVRMEKNYYIPDFNHSKTAALVFEDFVDTGSQTDMAIKKIHSLGGKVLGVISFTNSLGEHWPFGVPLNLTFVNLSFKKYLAGQCPQCRRQNIGTRP